MARCPAQNDDWREATISFGDSGFTAQVIDMRLDPDEEMPVDVTLTPEYGPKLEFQCEAVIHYNLTRWQRIRRWLARKIYKEPFDASR